MQLQKTAVCHQTDDMLRDQFFFQNGKDEDIKGQQNRKWYKKEDSIG